MGKNRYELEIKKMSHTWEPIRRMAHGWEHIHFCEFWYISKFYFWKDRIFIILELSPKLYFYKRSFHIKFTKDIILLWLIARCTSRLPQRKWWLVIEMILMITFTEVFSSSNFRMRMPLKKWMNVENWGKSYDLLK